MNSVSMYLYRKEDANHVYSSVQNTSVSMEGVFLLVCACLTCPWVCKNTNVKDNLTTINLTTMQFLCFTLEWIASLSRSLLTKEKTNRSSQIFVQNGCIGPFTN